MSNVGEEQNATFIYTEVIFMSRDLTTTKNGIFYFTVSVPEHIMWAADAKVTVTDCRDELSTDAS